MSFTDSKGDSFHNIGSWRDGDGFSFRVWAPECKSVRLALGSPVERKVDMLRDDDGYWSAHVPALESAALYMYELDMDEMRPDPVSKHQPDGVHGPSATLNHSDYKWSDGAWSNPPLYSYVIYELHIGAFTPEGTFDAAVGRIPYLVGLGVTAVEIMPVAQFPGERNWGYDGVHPFAVQQSYGGPMGLKRLVDSLHGAGIAVILDVVYNHLGPEGSYLSRFGPYFTDRYKTPWGDAINYDGPLSDHVRAYFIANALHWLRDYHFDALRLDAIHGIYDFSARHILSQMNDAVAMEFGCAKYLMAESDLNDARVIESVERGGYGLPAQWNDDYHHCIHTLLTRELDGYYMDFGGVEHMHKAISEGFVYSGQHSAYRRRRHGSSTSHVPPGMLVAFSQNHDQVGNRMMGERLCLMVDARRARLAAALVLMGPYVPLLFMGEEYMETAPFLYFTSHSDEGLIQAVREGRRLEFAAFAWKGEPPEPDLAETFIKSKLDIELSHKGPHSEMIDYYKKLIQIRRSHCAFGALQRSDVLVHHHEADRCISVCIGGGARRVVWAASFNDAPCEIRFRADWPVCELEFIVDTCDGGFVSKVDRVTIDMPVNLEPFSMRVYEAHAH